MDLDDTIAAVASAPGGGLRAIRRVSGSQTAACLSRVVRLESGQSIAATGTAMCAPARVELPQKLGCVPCTLYFWPTSRSYTRQPSAELHLPGSPPLVEAALDTICQAGA